MKNVIINFVNELILHKP